MKFLKFTRRFMGIYLLALSTIFLWTSLSYAGVLEEKLFEAARVGDSVEVRSLLAQGADVDASDKDGATALFYASLNGSPDTIKALREKGASKYVAGYEGRRASDMDRDISICQKEARFILESSLGGLLSAISVAIEGQYLMNGRNYPADSSFITNSSPPFMAKDYCGTGFLGYEITCTFMKDGYKILATPTSSTGTKIYWVSTGGAANF